MSNAITQARDNLCNNIPKFSLVVASYNRARIIAQTILSFQSMINIGEIIIIDDGSSVPYEESILNIISNVPTILKRNETQKGLPSCRNIGVTISKFDYILFCDDDIILSENYGAACLKKLLSTDALCVSGRIIYLEENQKMEDAKHIFQLGYKRKRENLNLVLIDHSAYIEDSFVTFTHSVFMWRKDDIMKIMFDERFSYGNAYFEEVVPQIIGLKNNRLPYVTNNTHAFHLPYSYIGGGGCAKSDLIRFWSATRNGFIFYKDYFSIIKNRFDLSGGVWLNYVRFISYQVKRQLINPSIVRVRYKILSFIKNTIRYRN